ncbi:MAG: tetratricopeptide repeat protein, partial [Planctomycetes bacterium]|nr:tetratricopeptide repeat protein [Planctomycetota bacterium]
AALLGTTPPENRETLLHRHAVSSYYLDKPQLCIETGAQLLKDYPKSQHLDDAHFVVAESHFKLSQWEGAVRHHSQVSEGSQFHKLATYQLARSYDQAGQKDKAAATYKKHFDLAPKEPSAGAALFRAAALCQELKAFAQAVELYALYERAFATPVTQQLKDARYQRAVCLLALEKHDEMFQAFQSYLKDYPDAAPRTRSNATYWIGWYYSQKEQSPSKAIECFQQASASEGDFQTEALYRLAEAHYALAQQAEKDKNEALARPHRLKAAEVYLELAKQNRELVRHTSFYAYAAAVFRSENRFPEAIRMYELLLEAFPQDAGLDEVHFYLGELHTKLQPPQWQEALQRY